MVKKLPRYLLGLVFVVFGMNGFLNFMPMPEMSAAGMKFIGGIMSADYFKILLKGSEVISGIMLLTGLFVPLALLILAPIVLNILLFHMFLEPSGMVMAVVLTVALLYVAKQYMSNFEGVLEKNADPS